MFEMKSHLVDVEDGTEAVFMESFKFDVAVRDHLCAMQEGWQDYFLVDFHSNILPDIAAFPNVLVKLGEYTVQIDCWLLFQY